jgi:hypothetical protein
VLCELHDAPEHPTGTQLRLLISQAHVDAVQPSVTLHGFDGGPIYWPWTLLAQRQVNGGRANEDGRVAFFVCDINWGRLVCLNPMETHKPTLHRLAISVINAQDQVIYRHQVTQRRRRSTS